MDFLSTLELNYTNYFLNFKRENGFGTFFWEKICFPVI